MKQNNTQNQINTLKQRLKTSSVISLYLIVLIIVALLADPYTNFVSKHLISDKISTAFIFYNVFIFLVGPFSYLIANELLSSFLNAKDYKIINILALCGLMIIPAYAFAYIFGVHQYFNNLFNLNDNKWKIYGLIVGVLFTGLLIYSLSYLCINKKLKDNNKSSYFATVTALVFFFYTAMYYIVATRTYNVFIFLLLIPILTDIFAYFCGSLFGKHHFSKSSPNKTIEGCVSGVVMTTVIVTLMQFMFYFYSDNVLHATYLNQFIGWQLDNTMNRSIYFYWYFICAVIVGVLSILAICGDLYFSKVKRSINIKDFGKLLPGHGGILDRIDSWIYVITAYVGCSIIFALFFNWYGILQNIYII